VAAGKSVLTELAHEVGRSLGFDLVVVERYDPMEHSVRVVAHAGVDAADLAALASPTHDGTLFGFQLGQAGVWELGGNFSERPGSLLGPLGITTLCCTPIRCGDQILGALSIGVRHPLDDEHAPHELLQSLADHLGAAWTASRLLELSRERSCLEHAARDGWVLAHELRNPLHTVSLQLASLRHGLAELPDPLRDALDRGLEALEAETLRLHELLQHYLRLGQQRPELRRARVLLADLLEGVLRFYELPFRTAGIVLELDVPSEPVPVVVDAAQISQVLHNLLRNALDAMPGGGCLTLRARSTPDAVELELRDSGPGIDDPEAALAFFASTRPGGSGLGLPVSREILRAHGGDLAILPASVGASLLASLPPVDPED
jgi:signal transduction histidine kinase